mgnify:CR=1 FL=1
MLQKLLVRMFGAMAAIGLLGTLVAYSICGKIDGDYVGFRSVFSSDLSTPDDPSTAQPEMDGIRTKVLAGGCAGILIGLGLPAGFRARKR